MPLFQFFTSFSVSKFLSPSLSSFILILFIFFSNHWIYFKGDLLYPTLIYRFLSLRDSNQHLQG